MIAVGVVNIPKWLTSPCDPSNDALDLGDDYMCVMIYSGLARLTHHRV